MILDVAKSLYDRRSKIKEAKRQERQDIAVYFDSVSKCLSDVHTKLKQGEYPHGSCKEMEQYAKMLPALIRNDMIPDIDKLASDLWSSRHIEDTYLILTDPDKEKLLARIDEAAGLFRSTATALRSGI